MLTLPTNIVCGSFDSRKFWDLEYSPQRTVQLYEIEFFMEDGAFVYADDEAFPIRKHHIQIKHPGQICCTMLPFRTMFLKFQAEGELARRLQASTGYFPCSAPETAMALLSKIILLHEQGEDGLAFYQGLLSFLQLVLTDADSHSREPEAVVRSKAFMEENFNRGITLDDIAKSVNLSPIYFHHVFSKAVGMSPHEYLTQQRIHESKKRLWNSHVPISQIAEDCGFGCQQYFSRVFKKQTGITPGQYRRSSYQNYLR